MEKLIRARSWGGNFLLNIGPAPDGTMRDGYYERCEALASWMAHSKESLIGAGPVKTWENFSNVPITHRDNIWYLHVLPKHKGLIEIEEVPKPLDAKLLHTGAQVQFLYGENKLVLALPENLRRSWNDVIVLRWKVKPDKK